MSTKKSPARLHRERCQAKAEAERNADPSQSDSHTVYELQLVQLVEHKRVLKGFQSVEKKIELKRDLVLEYDAYIDGVLEADTGANDDVVTTLLLWNIDAGRYDRALEIAGYALGHNLATPDAHQRTLGTVVAEELADAALRGDEVSLEHLAKANLLTLNHDMPDQVRAKLFKALGYALREKGERTEALIHLDRALQLHNGAGVKKDIERLQREIKKEQQSSEEGN